MEGTGRPKGDTAGKSEGSRPDTRLHLLNAAGEVFAAKGFDRATSREICERAGVNPAGVNYHFGGVEGMYAAALVMALRHIMQVDILSEIAAGDGTAEQKLRKIIEMMVVTLASPAERAWQIRLIGREIVAPSPMRESVVNSEILPKLRILRRLVGEITALDEDDPAVGRCVLSIVAPCLLLTVGDPRVLGTLMPNFFSGTAEAAPMTEHLVNFAMAGLAALAASAKAPHP